MGLCFRMLYLRCGLRSGGLQDGEIVACLSQSKLSLEDVLASGRISYGICEMRSLQPVGVRELIAERDYLFRGVKVARGSALRWWVGWICYKVGKSVH